MVELAGVYGFLLSYEYYNYGLSIISMSGLTYFVLFLFQNYKSSLFQEQGSWIIVWGNKFVPSIVFHPQFPVFH